MRRLTPRRAASSAKRTTSLIPASPSSLDVRKNFSPDKTALGESIRLDGISYQVIGVLRHQVQNGDDNINGHVYVPFSAMSDLAKTYYLNSVVMEYEGDHARS